MKLNWTSMLTGVFAGSLVTAGLGFTAAKAGGLEVSLANVKLIVNGSDQTNGGSFFNGETTVPIAFTYGDSTYVPLRYVSQALHVPINWDEVTRTISIGSAAIGSGTGSNGQMIVPPGRKGLGDIQLISSGIYSGTDSDVLMVKLQYDNNASSSWNFGSYGISFKQSNGSTYTASSDLPQGQEANVDAGSSRTVVYSASVPKGSQQSDFTLSVSNYDFTQQPASVTTFGSFSLPAASDFASTQNPSSINIGSNSAPTVGYGQPFIPPGRQNLGNVSVLSSDVYTGTDTDQLVVKLAYENDDAEPWTLQNYGITFQRFDGSLYTSSSNVPSTGASVDPKSKRIVMYTASVPKGSKAADFKAVATYQVSQQPALVTRLANLVLNDSTGAPAQFNIADTANLSFAPYSLTMSSSSNMGYTKSTSTQTYRYNITFTKPLGQVSYADDGDLEFDLVDSQGRLMSTLKYTMGTSAVFPTLPNGDTLLNFTGVNWSYYAGPASMNIYSYVQGAKKLLGTYTMP